MSRGYGVEALAWKEVSIGGIDCPKRRLEMVMGFGSGLAQRPGDPPDRVWAVGDRGPNLKVEVAVEMYGLTTLAQHAESDGVKLMPRLDVGPTLAELQVGADRVALVRMLSLRDASGAPLTGLPPPGTSTAKLEPVVDLHGAPIPPDPSGADTEGLVALPDGGFVVGDEYGPSLLLLDAEARVTARWVPQGCAAAFAGAAYPIVEALPAIAVHRRLNRGFEALTLSADGTQLILAFQSPLALPDKRTSQRARHVRLWVLDVATGALDAEYLYPLNLPAAFRRDERAEQGDVKVSEIVALADGSLLVLERVSQSTKFYRVRLDAPLAPEWRDPARTPSLEALSAAGESLPALNKTLVLDTDDAPEIGADLEGMAVLSPRELLLVNDNDFGCEGAVTGFWRVTFDTPVLG